jgi:hypothetical protein
MAKQGYIKLSRALQDSPIWISDSFSRGQAWVDLLLSAAHKDTFFYVRGTKVGVRRGQTAMSQLTMAKRWKWSRGKVKRFLNDLESEQMIAQLTGQLTTLVTICNYSVYQDGRTTDGTTGNTADGQQAEQQTDNRRGTFKNVKNVKNVEEIPMPGLADVECAFAFWKQAMGKSDRSQLTDKRKKKIQARLKNYSLDDIKLAITNCSKSPHHMGHNDTGTVYDDLELICRSDDNLERFRDMRFGNGKGNNGPSARELATNTDW